MTPEASARGGGTQRPPAPGARGAGTLRRSEPGPERPGPKGRERERRMSILDRFDITGQAAIVTGAGRGIGAACALALAEAGADVVITARTKEQLDAVAEQIGERGRRAVVVPSDVSDTANLREVVDCAVDELGRIDIVVNNAGGTMPQPFLDTSERAFEGAFHFNVTTAFTLTQLAVPHMLAGAGGGGSVVNISSAMGRLTDRGFVAYGTAKGALSHMTRLLAADLAPRIRVNAIAVGSVATSALEIVLENDELRDEMIAKTPLRRLGEPEDISLAALYLASPAGSFVTGKVWEVDGGIEHPNLGLDLPDL
jgi:7-alpha-hydroxysteroid dehydrogenase